jgi:uncharacterized membrane protein YfcA
MEPFVVILLLCLLVGALVGFLAGLLGIGGGLIIVPVLLSLFAHFLDLDLAHAMPMAIATSLFTIILTGSSASLTHYKLGNINAFVSFYSGIGIAIGAIFGAQLATHVSGQLLKNTFALLVLVIVLYMLFGKRKTSSYAASKPILSGVGGVTGFLSALMGIGGGVIMVPALVWFKVSIKQAIGCASFCGALIAVFGSLSFVQAGWNNENLPQYAFGYVYLPAGIGIVSTSVLTASYGVQMGHKLNTDTLKKVFSGFLIVISLYMLFG